MVDANLLVAGTGWPRFPYEVLQHAARGDYQLVVCTYVLEETRHHIRRIVPERLEQFETVLAATGCQRPPG
jgi:hypothetical protein